MRFIAYLTEPATYTIDLVKHVHEVIDLDYKYLQRQTVVKTDASEYAFNNQIYLDEQSIFSRIKILYNDYKKYDAIVFNGYNRLDFIFLLIIHLLSTHKTPIALESDTQLQIPSNPIKRWLKKTYLNFVFKNEYIHGLAGGEYIHKDLFRHFGMKEDRVHFLPMVIDVNRYKNPGISKSDHFTFLYVGRIIEHKNIRQLLSVFDSAFSQQVEVKLKVVGDGNLLNQLKDSYARNNKIEFTGALFGDELKQCYYHAHALVLPSFFEPWGLVVNEALAAGLPVIASRQVGATYDLIKGKETGYVFDTGSKNDLAQKMKSLSGDKASYLKKCKNAEKLMHDHWNYNLYALQMRNALKIMVDEK